MSWYNLKEWHLPWKKDFTLSSADAAQFFGQDYSWSNNQNIFPTLSTQGQENLAKKLDLVYMCLRAVHTAFISASLTAVKVDKNGEETSIPDYPMLDLFNANPAYTGDELKGFYVFHLLSTGTQYFWKWMNNRGNMVKEIYPLMPSNVTVKAVTQPLQNVKDSRVIKNYLVQPNGGQEYTLQPEEVCYTRIINPASLINGLSPLSSGSKAVSLEEKRYAYMGDALDSLKIPGPVIKTERGLTASQKEGLKARLSDKLGKQAARNMLHIGGKGVEIDFMNPLAEMNWKELTQLNETRICGVLGVPPLVAGAEVGLENSPWSNTGEAWRWFYRSTINTLWDQAERAWTRSFITDENIKFKFNRSDVAELQEDKTISATRATTLFAGGLVDRDRAREIAGEEKVGGDFGAQYILPMNLLPMSPSVTALPSMESSEPRTSSNNQEDKPNEAIGEMEEE